MRVPIRMLIALLAVVPLPGLLARGEEDANPDPDSSRPAEAQVTVEELIEALGSPLYQQRQSAREALLDIGPAAYDALRATYHDTDDTEVRLAIEDIVLKSYLDEHVFGRNAFLGVSHRRVWLRHADDPRVPRGGVGVQIDRVEEDTAAERYGVARGDWVIALDGDPIPPRENGFAEEIRQREPGSIVTLTILRDRDVFELGVRLGRRPIRFYNEPGLIGQVEQSLQEFRVWWEKEFAPPPAEAKDEE